MNATRHPLRFPRLLVLGSLLALSLLPAVSAQAQDNRFLACARFDDRAQRIACLEDALEAAVAAQGDNRSAVSSTAPTMPAPTVPAPTAPTAPVAATVTPVPAAPAANTPTAASTSTVEVTSEERSLLDRLRSFGRSDTAVAISSDDSGQDQLQDSISALDKRKDLWIVTLSSGQVWRQAYPRQLLLREGDAVTIYREGIGNGFRLSTPRLSGFIRIERVK